MWIITAISQSSLIMMHYYATSASSTQHRFRLGEFLKQGAVSETTGFYYYEGREQETFHFLIATKYVNDQRLTGWDNNSWFVESSVKSTSCRIGINCISIYPERFNPFPCCECISRYEYLEQKLICV